MVFRLQAQFLHLGREHPQIWLPAQHRLDLAQHRPGSAGVGDGQVGAGELQAGLYREVRERVRQPQAQRLRSGEERVGARGVLAVQCDARSHRIGECAGGVPVHP